MKSRRLIIVLIIINLITIESVFSQKDQKGTSAVRIDIAPTIDGRLDEEIWETTPELTDFIQYIPNNGLSASQKTFVKICYDDEAFYIGASLLDTSPDSMGTEFGNRDAMSTKNAELVCVYFNPYNDGINGFYFSVSIRNVQSDYKTTSDGEQKSWDAIWESNTTITNDGWMAEFKIPFSELRFSIKAETDWGFNLFRYIPRYKEWSTWSYMSKDIEPWWKQNGILTALEDFNPPRRLSFIPYITNNIEKNSENDWKYSFIGGMDIKYGINESFTIDATLIPDFGQVQSDNLELNLTPYELQFNEKRQFFTEGMELYNKGGIFYSRRIGEILSGFNNVEDYLLQNEIIDEIPAETRLINSTKISGRTKRALGFGFMNSMTGNTYATAIDTTTNKKRSILTQPFTNYNITVLDQALKNSSYISFINTNVYNDSLISNVSAIDFKINDKTKNYSIDGVAEMSYRNKSDNKENGYKYALSVGKKGGKFRYHLYSYLTTEDFNINDLGYLQRNNEFNNNINLSYIISQPFGRFLSLSNNIQFINQRLFNPSKFSRFYIRYTLDATFKNMYNFYMHASLTPIEENDYYESRTEGRVFNRPRSFHNCMDLTSDTRKPIWIKSGISFDKSYSSEIDWITYILYITPSFRISDQFSISLNSLYSKI